MSDAINWPGEGSRTRWWKRVAEFADRHRVTVETAITSV
jgi:hypothetical protein